MGERQQILERWRFPHQQRDGVTLVARQDAIECVRRIFAEGCRFYGYDSFTVNADFIQPHMEFSPSWPKGTLPPLDNIIGDLRKHPPEITDYEFVFEDDL